MSATIKAPVSSMVRRPCVAKRSQYPSSRLSHRSRSVICRAEFKAPANEISRTVNVMLKKYDFLSTGMGALCVTGYCWSRGQPPLEALTITAVSTIMALVVNEVFFSDTHPKQ